MTKDKLIRAVQIIGVFILLLATLFAVRKLDLDSVRTLISPNLVLMLIGVVPLLLLYRLHTLRMRVALADLSAAFLGFGAVLVPLQYLLQINGYPLNDYPIVVLYVEITLGQGFINALRNRNRLHDRVVYLRWVIFMASLLAPATALPALITTGAMVRNNAAFHNDWLALLCWASLLLPPLIAFWFYAIGEIRKGDGPQDAQ